MKLTNRMLALGCVAGVAVVSFGCGDDTSPASPIAPSASPAVLASTNRLTLLSGRNAVNEASLGTDTVDLKSTAATPSTPINNVEVDRHDACRDRHRGAGRGIYVVSDPDAARRQRELPVARAPISG